MADSYYFFRFAWPNRWGFWGLLGAVCLAWSTPALADRDDHDRALQAVQRGDALSLQALMERVPVLRQGQLLEVELEQSKGRWVYEIKSLEAGGRLVKRKLDARTGDVLQAKDKSADLANDRGRP